MVGWAGPPTRPSTRPYNNAHMQRLYAQVYKCFVLFVPALPPRWPCGLWEWVASGMCEAYREAQWQAARDDLVTWLESSSPGASPAQSSSERPSAHSAPPSAPNRTDDGGGLGVVLTRNQLIHHWQRSRECRSPNQSEGRWRAAGACYMGPPSLRWCGRPLGIHLPRLGSPHTLARSIGDPPRSHRAHPRVGPGNAYVAERGGSER